MFLSWKTGTTCSSTLIFSALAGIKVRFPGYHHPYSLTESQIGRFLQLAGVYSQYSKYDASYPCYRMGGVHRGGENCMFFICVTFVII